MTNKIKVEYDKQDLRRMKRYINWINFITPALRLIANSMIGSIIVKQIKKDAYKLAYEASKNVTLTQVA